MAEPGVVENAPKTIYACLRGHVDENIADEDFLRFFGCFVYSLNVIGPVAV